MTFPVSRPRARLTMAGEIGGRRAMRCMWQPMGQDDLACDMERNARRPRRAAYSLPELFGRSRITAKHLGSMSRIDSRAAGGPAGLALHVGVGSLLYVLGRQSLGPALPSWRGLQAVNVPSSFRQWLRSHQPVSIHCSLQPSPGRTPYTGQPPK